mmetsp:Transcript_12604/g.34332  ORF Transcript_12604/g.34332 Transcript_12604/m.34332 type:complete len:282 (+) Transcript_12604:531-1376(+)
MLWRPTRPESCCWARCFPRRSSPRCGPWRTPTRTGSSPSGSLWSPCSWCTRAGRGRSCPRRCPRSSRPWPRLQRPPRSSWRPPRSCLRGSWRPPSSPRTAPSSRTRAPGEPAASASWGRRRRRPSWRGRACPRRSSSRSGGWPTWTRTCSSPLASSSARCTWWTSGGRARTCPARCRPSWPACRPWWPLWRRPPPATRPRPRPGRSPQSTSQSTRCSSRAPSARTPGTWAPQRPASCSPAPSSRRPSCSTSGACPTATATTASRWASSRAPCTWRAGGGRA